ncbi:MAG: hypothetical protein NZL89_02410 [Leptospiraceae bacterium]|nr:hypothetical protein [Leptospiraceae bacterium]
MTCHSRGQKKESPARRKQKSSDKVVIPMSFALRKQDVQSAEQAVNNIRKIIREEKR